MSRVMFGNRSYTTVIVLCSHGYATAIVLRNHGYCVMQLNRIRSYTTVITYLE